MGYTSDAFCSSRTSEASLLCSQRGAVGYWLYFVFTRSEFDSWKGKRFFLLSFIQAKLLVICVYVFASGPFRIELNQYYCPPSTAVLATYVRS